MPGTSDECDCVNAAEVAVLLNDFQRDFEETSLTLLGQIRSTTDPTALLSNVTALLEILSEEDEAGVRGPETNTDTEEDVIQRVATDLVPSITEELISRSFPTEESALEVNCFIQHSLGVAARNLLRSNKPEVILPFIVAALDAHSPFYLYHSSETARDAGGKRNREVIE